MKRTLKTAARLLVVGSTLAAASGAALAGAQAGPGRTPATIVGQTPWNANWTVYDFSTKSLSSGFVVPRITCGSTPTSPTDLQIQSAFDGSSGADPGQLLVASLTVQAYCAASGDAVVPQYLATVQYSGSTTLSFNPAVAAGDKVMWKAVGNSAGEKYTFTDANNGGNDTFNEEPLSFNDLTDGVTLGDGFPAFAKTGFYNVLVGGTSLGDEPGGHLKQYDATDDDGNVIVTVSDPVGKNGSAFLVTDTRDASGA